MEFKRCFEPGCVIDVEVICPCTSPETYSCVQHIGKHLKLSNNTHTLEPISAKPCKRTKNSILLCLAKEKVRRNKRKTSNSLNQQLTVSENYLREKRLDILSRPNDPELEQEFRKTCSLYESDSNNNDSPSLMQAYQNYVNAYRLKTSLYHIIETDSVCNLLIYDTESESLEVKILESMEINPYTSISQLPNGKLFCLGKIDSLSIIALIIDLNGGVERLPSAPLCQCCSAIYFDNNVYCLGGYNYHNNKYFTLSSKFNLTTNRWTKLPPMPEIDDCNCVIFNGNILISGWQSRNLWLYSIDIDSYSTIPYNFEENKWKLLINAKRRLYVIEFGWEGSIYESEVGSFTNWKWILWSIIAGDINQVYCSYNKGAIYISCVGIRNKCFYKFNLSGKSLLKL